MCPPCQGELAVLHTQLAKRFRDRHGAWENKQYKCVLVADKKGISIDNRPNRLLSFIGGEWIHEDKLLLFLKMGRKVPFSVFF